MEEFWRYLGAAVGLAVIALTVRSGHRVMGTAFSLLAGTALLLVLAPRLQEAVATLRALTNYAARPEGQTATVLKLLGVGFAAEFAAQACRDAGEEGLALRVELAGKVLLMVLCAPMLEQMARLILELTA